MRKHYLLWMILLLPFFKLNAQTYCTPTTGGTSTTNYLKNAIFSDQGAFYYDSTTYQAYVDNSASQMVTSYPGGTVKVHLEFSVSGTKSLVWVDWNSNGNFNDFYENPIGVSAYSTVDGDFFVPPAQAPGIYRIRVQTGTNLTTSPNPCGPNSGGNGNFVDFSLKIEPAAPTCYVPSALTSSNITTSTATISWTAPATAPANGYEYYYTSSTTVPTASTPESGTSTTTSKPLSGLASFTTYYYYVRSVCGASNKSAWSLRGTFKTKCDPMTSMFQDFETATTGAGYVVDCWDKIILGTGYMSVTAGSGVNNSKAMNLNTSGTANAVMAVLPAFSNVNAGTHWLRFKAKTGSSSAGLLDIGYLTNDVDASTFVNIQSVSVGNAAYDGYEYSVVVPNTVPANARLAIRHNGVPNNSLYLDNVYWEPKPTCIAPSNVVLSNTTSASVDIAWTAPTPAPALGYDVYYSTSNTPPTSSTAPSVTGVTANPYTLPGLNSATTYYIWVRSRCSATDQSAWTNTMSVLTLCAPQTSLFENFDAYNTGLIETNAPCWKKLVNSGSVNINSMGAYSGTRHILQRPLTGTSMAILPELSNINAGTHSLTFRAYCSVNTGKIKVGYITNLTDINSFVLIQDVNITNTSYTGSSEYSVAIPNTVPATARLVLYTTYTEGGNVLYYWDNISWAPTAALGTSEVTAKHDIAIYPNPFTDMINISGDVPLQSASIYDASGRLVKEIKSSEKTISLHELNSGVYVIKLTLKNGSSKTIKAVKK
ncbi:fibronectin type III domain-containing protein [Chryseobacterium camelliae]|uniref:Fibronectin type III domain-containing protein n=1 Tax=Chryseobacterium camelliae TaxID=1265445 RepID=A0ABY7QJ71_9FLAO|nr:fibronectin type III domain-containing protein [Chryseobacterium camelliae]WBV59338.1 fibronectin type III domain-containing protein [Chryseobacterium camelliae]